MNPGHLGVASVIEKAPVAIDAMGCQKEIAAQIRQQKGHFLLRLKGNQPTLQADLEVFFDEAGEESFVGVSPRRRGSTSAVIVPGPSRWRRPSAVIGPVKTRSMTSWMLHLGKTPGAGTIATASPIWLPFDA